MITSKQSYFNRTPENGYYKINTSFDSTVGETKLIAEEKIIEVDLNSRVVDTKGNLSQYHILLNDNYSESIYFMFDRYFDGQDLSKTYCYIAFFNAKREAYAFPIENNQYYFVVNEEDQKDKIASNHDDADKLVIEWSVPYAATKYVGTVQFCIKFYIINDEEIEPAASTIDKLTDDVEDIVEKKSQSIISYKLNTRPATFKIEDTLSVEGNGDRDIAFLAEDFEQFIAHKADEEANYDNIYIKTYNIINSHNPGEV